MSGKKFGGGSRNNFAAGLKGALADAMAAGGDMDSLGEVFPGGQAPMHGRARVPAKAVSAGRQTQIAERHEQVAAEMAARAAAAEAKNGQGNAGNSAVSAAGKDSSGVKMEL